MVRLALRVENVTTLGAIITTPGAIGVTTPPAICVKNLDFIMKKYCKLNMAPLKNINAKKTERFPLPLRIRKYVINDPKPDKIGPLDLL